MVLISLHPFALRKVLLVGVALLGFSALCFADPVLMVRRYTGQACPLDRSNTFVQAEANDSWVDSAAQMGRVTSRYEPSSDNVSDLTANGGVDLWEVNCSSWRSPASVLSSTLSPVGFSGEREKSGLRKS
jgi:hypothetical protein